MQYCFELLHSKSQNVSQQLEAKNVLDQTKERNERDSEEGNSAINKEKKNWISKTNTTSSSVHGKEFLLAHIEIWRACGTQTMQENE